MEARPLNEAMNDVTESLDASVFNDATTLLPPASPTLKDPETKPSQPVTAYHIPKKGAETYELEMFEKNRMIIFNHEEFKNRSRRDGTELDETALRETFQKYRFEIDNTHEDLYKTVLLDTIKKFALKSNFEAYGCICVAVLTHGDENKPGILNAYDEEYSENEIFKHFDASKNASLAGKPIIFLIQACRGHDPSEPVSVVKKKPALVLDHGEDLEDYSVPTGADRIVFHSTYPGKASIRDQYTGSWFIQALCKKIEEFASIHDLETIFRLVKRTVALHADEEQPNWKQMPVVTSTLLREIRFASNGEDEQPRSSTENDFESAMDDRQQSEKLEDRSPNSTLQPENAPSSTPQQENAPSSTHQQEKEPPPPPSRFVYRSEMNDPEVYPLSEHIADKLKKHVTDAISTPESGDTPKMLMELHHLPCCCFVEYFDYLKKCLETFSRHNPEDSVAKHLLTVAERTEPGQEFNLQRFHHIQFMWEHLESNYHLFPLGEGFSFVHRMYVPPKPGRPKAELD